MGTHNICFHGVISKLSILLVEKCALSGTMTYSHSVKCRAKFLADDILFFFLLFFTENVWTFHMNPLLGR